MVAPPPRGAILKCSFPYETAPNQPGPQPHYCLFAGMKDLSGTEWESRWGQIYVVAYGTSRLDDAMIRVHARQGILSVSSQFIRGAMPGEVTHFLAGHVATLPAKWVYQNFTARLDFMRPESRENDQYRLKLYEQFTSFEAQMEEAAVKALAAWATTGRLGLPPGSRLRSRKR